MQKFIKSITISLFSIIFLIACGGGGSSPASSKDDGGGTTPPITKTLSGKTIDGLIQNATVCLDINNNETCDTNEPTTTTDENGLFTLDITNTDGEYTIISTGGIDTATNQFFDSVL